MGRWMAIKNKKGAADAQKGVALAKFSHNIIAAAKQGGPDPAGNFRLRTAIEKAKAGGLPMSKIENAIAKASGGSNTDEVEALTYEGYGPSGVAILIEIATDNRNRTAGDIRSYFNKFEGNLGQDGCVAYLFEERGLVEINPAEALKAGFTLEGLLEVAADAGAMDVEEEIHEESGQPNWLVWTEPSELNAVCTGLTQAKLAIASAELTRLPQTWVAVDDYAVARPLFRLLEAIENQDDVQRVYSNAQFSPAVLAQWDAEG